MDLLPSERLSLVGWWLARGERLTVRQLSERTGCTISGAAKLLERVSVALPIAPIDEVDGAAVWGAIDRVNSGDDAR